jgi:hypothetical protein
VRNAEEITVSRAIETGRNDRCPCGSGKKFKQCCYGRTRGLTRGNKLLLGTVAGLLAAGLAVAAATFLDRDEASPGRVWSVEHGHWHEAR